MFKASLYYYFAILEVYSAAAASKPTTANAGKGGLTSGLMKCKIAPIKVLTAPIIVSTNWGFIDASFIYFDYINLALLPLKKKPLSLRISKIFK
jgi:hypothetical protein